MQATPLRRQPPALCCVPVPQKHQCQHRSPTGSCWALLILHTAPHPSGRVTALLLRDIPAELTKWPSQALVIHYCKQTNLKGLRGCTPPHLHLRLVQHSTVLCLGQSFSKFQSGFVSKSTFHYQHQVHFSGLACFTTIYTVRAISGSNQFLQNPAKQLACSLPQEQPSRLLEA